MNKPYSLTALAGLGMLMLMSTGTLAQSKHSVQPPGAKLRNSATEVSPDHLRKTLKNEHRSQGTLPMLHPHNGLATAHPLPVRSTGKADADQTQFATEDRGGAPLNNNCGGAISLTMGSSCSPTNGTVDQATQSLAAINCATFTGNANDDVWYSFVATASDATIVVECNEFFDAVIDLRTAACNGANIDCMDNFIAGGSETLLATGLSVGTTYNIRVYDYEAGFPADPTFSICVFGTPEPPANDLCDNAAIEDISVPGSATVNGDNTGAQDTEGFGVASAWEAFTIDACADVVIDYCGTDPAFGNAFLNLSLDCAFSGTHDNAGFDVTTCPDGNVTIFYEDVPAGTYYYPILTEAGAEGPYTINITAVACGAGPTPPNDLCVDATVQDITVPGSASVNGDNTGATDTEGIGTASAWEAFTIDACADVTLNYCGTDPVFGNFFIAIATDCDLATVIDATDFGDCGDGNLSILFEDLAAGTYYVPVLTEAGSEGPYTIEISAVACGSGPTPPNDLCDDAAIQDITVPGSASVNGDNTGATDTEGLGVASAWEAFTIDACADVTIDYCGTDPAFENAFLNLALDCAGSGIFEHSTFDVTTCGDDNVTIFYQDVPAGTYYYPVLTEAGAEGPYTINITAVACGGGTTPANDNCGDVTAEDLNVGATINFTGDNTDATVDGDYAPGSPLDGETLASVWHAFTTTECTNVAVSYCGTDPAFLNAWIILATDCPADELTFSNSFNTTECGDGNITIHYVGLPAGTYYLPVMNDPTPGSLAVGPYTIDVSAEACSPTPPNDDCGGAVVLDVNLTCEPTTGSVFGATESFPADSCNGFVGDANDDVWYQFVATSPFTTITVQGNDTLDAVIQLFAGDCNGTLTPLACGDVTFYGGEEEIIMNDLEPGFTYYVRVFHYYTALAVESDFEICITSDVGTGVVENTVLSTNVRPNPSNGDLSFTYAGNTANVLIDMIDMTGRIVHAERSTLTAGQQVDLALSGKLAAGTYTLRLTTANTVAEQRVMVR